MQKIDNYKVVEKIGEGGMATVYKARQLSLNRLVAIKVLSKKLTEHKEIVERFNQEALIIAKLTHPNIIHIIDRGVINGRCYFVMDFVEGTDLAGIIKEKIYNTNKKIDVIIPVCKALSYAHKNGIIHRDIKPGNILIDFEGHTMVSDFGIAQLFNKPDSGGEQLTKEGAVMGTIAYMSPEQKLNSKSVTSATDIYSLGVVMYEMFTGAVPLGRFQLPSKINPEVSKELENLMLKCLETKPTDRFKLADDLKDQLLEILQGAHIKKNQKDQVFKGMKNISDNFSLLDIIKETDFGAVYLFEKKENKTLLVIKKVENQQTGFTESRILSKLAHKNIIEIYGVSGDKNRFIIVMKYIAGGSLKERLIRAHPCDEALNICREICEGLSYAHKNNIIHGNLRPSNVLISETGEVNITDFGLTEHYDSEGNQTNWYHPSGEPKSRSTDIFASGVIFYQIFTGATPTWQDSKLVFDDQFKKLPLKVQMMITKMISADRTSNYDSFDRVIDMIDNISKAQEKKGNKFLLIIVIILLLFVIAFTQFFYIW